MTPAQMILDHLGPEAGIEFLRAFAGQVLRIPSMPKIERIARDLRVVAALHHNPATPTVR